jgi:hypothetical protein
MALVMEADRDAQTKTRLVDCVLLLIIKPQENVEPLNAKQVLAEKYQ